MLHPVAAPYLPDPSGKPSPYIDCIQAAAFLGGLNPRVVCKWAREGYIPAVPIGEGKRRLWRFRRSDLDKWMQARMTGTLSLAADAPTLERNHGW